MLKDLILKNRSYRRFDQSVRVSHDDLMTFVELARLSSSGANLQSLKYIISSEDDMNQRIFKHLKWAGYLPEWPGPSEGERPTGYIVVCHDKSISKTYFWDHGIVAQSIMLGATEKGFGGCMFGAFNKAGIVEDLMVPDHLDVLMVLAIGKPIEEIVLEELDASGSIKYYRDDQGIHHVPKRSLESLIIKLEE